MTERCLVDDLADSVTASFKAVQDRHGIVRAFRRERRLLTDGAAFLGPAGGERPLSIVRHTHHWRAVTWFDEEADVVWLCAVGGHRSGAADDAFPMFERLRDQGVIWPVEVDYEGLAADRGQQFAAFVVADAPVLLAQARATPGQERVLVIGREPLAILVRVVETLEETYVAFSSLRLTPSLVQLILVALFPDRPFDDWRFENRLPTRDLDHTRAEICFSIVHG